MIPFDWFQLARTRIQPHINQTPLTWDTERGLFLKWENHQVTGSFKSRGAINKVLSLEEWERRRGLVAASAGNHGQGVALAGQLTDCQVEIFVPDHAAAIKIERMRAMGAGLHLVEGGYAAAEAAAKQHAERENKTFISPYNDPQIIAGQGTLALEVLAQMEKVTPIQNQNSDSEQLEQTWLVPVGGGGLISACGAVLAKLKVASRLIGIQPEASAFTYNLFHRGTQDGVEDRPTLADGLSGAIEADSITVPMLRTLVNSVIVVSEEDIQRAVAFAWYTYNQRIEGSAAVTLAALMAGQVKSRPCVLVLSGGNIDATVFESILAKHKGAAWN